MRKLKIAAVLLVITILVIAQRLGIFEQLGSASWAESEPIDRGSSWRVTWIAVNQLWRTATAARRRGDR